MSTQVIRIMIVDDHDMVRRGLATFLDAFPDLELVGEAANGREALEICRQAQPDVILMDLMMPEMDGPTATRAIREMCPATQIIALTSFEEKNLVQAALNAGAIGYLLKSTEPNLLADAIRKASSGEPALGPEATRALMEVVSQPTGREYDLTPRELEVLGLMAQGQTNAQIALALDISRATVKTYVSSILGKMSAASRTEAVAIALQHKLV